MLKMYEEPRAVWKKDLTVGDILEPDSDGGLDVVYRIDSNNVKVMDITPQYFGESCSMFGMAFTVIGHADSMADILCPELRAIVEVQNED